MYAVESFYHDDMKKHIRSFVFFSEELKIKDSKVKTMQLAFQGLVSLVLWSFCFSSWRRQLWAVIESHLIKAT